ncbi:hypothetical protein PsorP6_017856 [Peronosclerospora sorghi]|uniref:Uncharacterized protein n=1 Tax=Peronosclerospora sorghi TaxID=230839 RepID=A0ACC0WCB3_9STRA|nr:hypothetical protein PsorP6_017856 [Peronosclerospora sorghi]
MTVFDEIRQIKWAETQRVPELSPYSAQTVFQLKANKVKLWNHDSSTSRARTPHEATLNTPTSSTCYGTVQCGDGVGRLPRTLATTGREPHRRRTTCVFQPRDA